jgi:PKD repeat protein
MDYDWDFGDGNHASGASVDHTYAKSGNYSVTLRVKDSQGLSRMATALLPAEAPTSSANTSTSTSTSTTSPPAPAPRELDESASPPPASPTSTRHQRDTAQAFVSESETSSPPFYSAQRLDEEDAPLAYQVQAEPPRYASAFSTAAILALVAAAFARRLID